MLWPWIMAFGLPLPLLAWRAERRFRALPALPGADPAGGPLPALSIIIPARDEAENLAGLLPTLSAQAYPGPLEVIVVDDSSADDTAQTASRLGAAVLAAGPLPPGWLGKPHACHTGAQAAAGEWLLFIDADTRHAPDSAARAVRAAVGSGLDGLSLLLREEAEGPLERLAMMAAFTGLFAGSHPSRPVLNGQYVLLRKQGYLESGGYAAVRDEPLEDLALAHRLRRCGYEVPLMAGFEAASVCSYRSLPHAMRGLARLCAGSLKWSGRASGLTILFIAGAVQPILGIPLVLFAEMPPVLLAASWAITAIGFLPWARRWGGGGLALLAPVGAFVVLAAAVHGLFRRLAGAGFDWKGRRV